MKRNKQYKALVLDVDGTLIPNQRDGKPSARVIDAINSAKEEVAVCIASGRPLSLLINIFRTLDLSGPAIILGGAQIVNAKTHKVYWQKPIDKKTISMLLKELTKISVPLYHDDAFNSIQISKSAVPDQAFSLYTGVNSLKPEKAEKVLDVLTKFPSLAGHIVPGWISDVAVNITHASATKQHGILEVARILKIDTQNMIGVGDGGNDLPLLMACGLKVAMGNANEDLKAIADYIAPSVDEDGVVDVIEKFILSKQA